MFIYPHIARSTRASVRARFVSTELVKNVDRIDRRVLRIGSSGLKVWWWTSCGVPGMVDCFPGGLLIPTGTISWCEQGWLSRRLVASLIWPS